MYNRYLNQIYFLEPTRESSEEPPAVDLAVEKDGEDEEQKLEEGESKESGM